jgi:hypothetical protein
MAVADGAAGATRTARIALPKGMTFYVSHAYAYADAITDNAAYPSLTVGSGTSAASLVAAVNLATGTGALTLLTNLMGSATTATQIVVTVANNATSVFAGTKVCLVGFYASPPTTYEAR